MPYLPGTDDNNILVGTVGNDTIDGFAGDDTIDGGLGNDLLQGGFGDDVIADDGGRDTLSGGQGNDYLLTRDLSGDTLYGDAGYDVAYLDRRDASTLFIFSFDESSGIGTRFSDGTEMTGVERLFLYLGSGNDIGAITLIGMRTDTQDRSQVGFGDGVDLLRINLANFDTGITMSPVPFTPGSNVRFLSSDAEVFSALSVERLDVNGSRMGDRLEGLSRADTLSGNGGHDSLQGGGGKDRIFGGAGDDQLDGGAGDDAISGGNGTDTLTGGPGRDRLTGGAGQDTFLFYDALARGNVDIVTDFNVADDVLILYSSAFAGLDPATFDSSAFVANRSGTARSAEDRILYETDTGRLFFDADGTGDAARIHFATLSVGLTLTGADFLVL